MTLPDVRWLIADDVTQFHETLNVALPGESLERTVSGTLASVRNQIEYGGGDVDVLYIACLYGARLARSHCFNEGNKRTALMSLKSFLNDNGYQLVYPDDVGLADLMESLASGEINESDLYDIFIDHIAYLD